MHTISSPQNKQYSCFLVFFFLILHLADIGAENALKIATIQ